ncbi:Regulator of sigma-E protease RseP [BD1-7 clade bacterium]|uniref:Zinc metalloprotease n=1 Tax=BD1-7 clade bacterium TaxID=2029982 RepID=A0A5S9PWU2_9GAMM|nr:Regulator of sigma-E protease RseP [BD1-7 clade bacterium]
MLVTLGVLISFHEYGHFWVARRCGVKVLRFSIGFGKPFFTRTDKHGTEFALAAIPLGGYVKMLDEREGDVAPEERHFAFNNKPVGQRIAIVSAGPIANFLLAILVYWFVFLQGTTHLAPVVYGVSPGSIAAEAGLKPGQEIVSVDGAQTASAESVLMNLLDHIGTTGDINLLVRSDNAVDSQRISLPVNQWLSDQHGEVDTLGSLGFHFYRPEIKPIIAEVLSGSAAEAAGLKAGDELLSADGQTMAGWRDWVDVIQQHAGMPMAVEYLRDDRVAQTTLKPEAVNRNGKTVGLVGIRVDVPEIPASLLRRAQYNVLSAWLPAADRTWKTAVFSLTSLMKMASGQISYKQLSGPISIAKVANDSVKSGIFRYLSLLALLSVSLGVLNLLPIPVLDGGHIFFYLIEWVKGSPVSEKIQLFAYQFGLAIVLAVMVLAVVNDISRL